MASTRREGICFVPTLLRAKPGAAEDKQTHQEGIFLQQHHHSFSSIVGRAPTHALLLSAETSQSPFFQSACVHLPDSDELYTTSQPLRTTGTQAPVVLMSKVQLRRADRKGEVNTVEWQKLRPPVDMPMPAAGCLVPRKQTLEEGGGPETILFCSQGNLSRHTGGVYLMPRGERPIACVTEYHGKPFNSPHGATLHPDWSIWFTDPAIGHEAGFREQPMLPPQIYRYDSATQEVRAMADGFQKPVGIAIDATRERLYVSDAGARSFTPAGQAEQGYSFLSTLTGSHNREDGTSSDATATIYAFDIVHVEGSPFLVNRRLFAFAKDGVPKQLHCDTSGNVWAACGDGVEVWSPTGTLMGVIQVSGGVSSFCHSENSELFLCAGKALWCMRLAQ